MIRVGDLIRYEISFGVPGCWAEDRVEAILWTDGSDTQVLSKRVAFSSDGVTFTVVNDGGAGYHWESQCTIVRNAGEQLELIP